jgi:hypothetical protein
MVFSGLCATIQSHRHFWMSGFDRSLIHMAHRVIFVGATVRQELVSMNLPISNVLQAFGSTTCAKELQ